MENSNFSSSSSSPRKNTIPLLFAGHRGSGANQVQSQRPEAERYPENSLIGIKKAIGAGVKVIEFDLFCSRDEELMVTHDDDLSIHTKYIIQTDGEGGHIKGERISIPAGKTFVKDFRSDEIQERFDISNNIMLSNVSDEEKSMYQKIPMLQEVLELVSKENEKFLSPEDRVKLNIELKGKNTGYHVQKVINDFNGKQTDERRKINSSEIFFLAFDGNELAAIAGLIPSAEGIIDKKANLILGIPTSAQYKNVDENYVFNKDAPLNEEGLKNWGFVALHTDLQKLTERLGKGLTAVDMSLWDVTSKTIEYFCKMKKIPVHVAVVPFERENFETGDIRMALQNIQKVQDIQSQYLDSTKDFMLVKTDNPILLQNILSAGFQALAPEQVRSSGIRDVNDFKPRARSHNLVVERSELRFFPKPIHGGAKQPAQAAIVRIPPPTLPTSSREQDKKAAIEKAKEMRKRLSTDISQGTGTKLSYAMGESSAPPEKGNSR